MLTLELPALDLDDVTAEAEHFYQLQQGDVLVILPEQRHYAYVWTGKALRLARRDELRRFDV